MGPLSLGAAPIMEGTNKPGKKLRAQDTTKVSLQTNERLNPKDSNCKRLVLVDV